MKKEQLTPAMLAAMSPEDWARYAPGLHASTYAEDPNPPIKTGSLERNEQKDFANYCLRHGYTIVWHATHQKSTATRGTPDFIVAAHGKTFWIEFKLPGSDLSKDQKAFRESLEQNGVTFFIAYSSHEAMRIIDPDCR